MLHTHTFPLPLHTAQPSSYNVTELTVKTALFTGGQDWLADPTDVANLIPKIKDVTFYHKNISYYDHLDFIWGLDAATQVYSEIVTQIRNMLWCHHLYWLCVCVCRIYHLLCWVHKNFYLRMSFAMWHSSLCPRVSLLVPVLQRESLGLFNWPGNLNWWNLHAECLYCIQ